MRYQFQLYRTISSGIAGDTATPLHIITHPAAGATFRLDTVPRTHGTLDTTTGVLTFEFASLGLQVFRDAGDSNKDKIKSTAGFVVQRPGNADVRPPLSA